MRRIGENIIPHALWPLLRRAAADLEGFAHSAAADGERRAAQGKKTRSDDGDMLCECLANAVRMLCECRPNAARRPCECRANAVRMQRSSPRRLPSGLTFLYVPAAAAIWSYVCACLSAGGGWQAIWTYVFACFSARCHTDLRLCMWERRGRSGECKCCCGSSFVHMEGSAAAGGEYWLFPLFSSFAHI